MSLLEVPALTYATNVTPPSTPEQDATALSAAQYIDVLKAQLRNVRIELDESKVRLLHSRIRLQSEAQSRQTLQQGLNAHEQTHFQLAKSYKSMYEEFDREKIQLQNELRNANERIESLEQQISMLQSQQQQPPASHLVQGGPLLSQYNDHNDSRQYLPYQPPRSHDFIIDPTGLCQLENLDYSIGLPLEPCCNCDLDPVMSASVAENQPPNMSIQSMLHPAPAEGDAPGPTHTKSEETKTGLADEGAKPSKKRKTKGPQ